MIRLSILLFLTFIACTPSPEPATHFYDWNKELNRLSSSPLSVKKTVILDGTAEVIDSVQVDLAKEWEEPRLKLKYPVNICNAVFAFKKNNVSL